MARKFIELKSGCMAKAFEDEPTFVLLGRDPAAPVAIRAWIAERLRSGKNQVGDLQIFEARGLLTMMENEQEEWARRRAMQKEGITQQEIAETMPPRVPEIS